MEPVKVKVYGLFTVTKKKYIYQLLMTVLMAGGLFYAWLSMPRFDADKGPKEFVAIMTWIDRVPYLVAGVLVLVSIEALLVFRAFARKEAAQRDEQEKQAAVPPPVAASEVHPDPAGQTAPTQPEPVTEVTRSEE